MEIMTKILRKLELEYKDKFEKTYGVEIHVDALFLACNITFKYSNVLSDEGGIGDNHMAVLEKKAAEMVEKACVKLRDDLDMNVEEQALDSDYYSLRRALVESDENFREKDSAKNFWLPRVKKDYGDIMNKWQMFILKFEPLLSPKSYKEERADEVRMLEEAYQMMVKLVSRLREIEDVNRLQNLSEVALAGQSLGTVVTKLMLSIHENFKQNLTLTPCLLAEVASPPTGIPASWLLHFSEPPLEGLQTILAKGLFGQNHVLPLVSKALSSRKYHPIGSFLFLDGFGQGWIEIANALAEQLFEDKKRVIVFDLSEYSDSGSVSRLIGRPSSSSNLTGLLTEAVKPFNVVLFHNVDRAHPSVTDVLIEIISHGRVSNGQGYTTDFAKTLIIMTSNVMDGKVQWRPCKCGRIARAIPLLSRDPLQQETRCICREHLREVRKHFRHDLLEKVDDVIFFKVFSFEEYMAAARLQLRDIASSMTEKRLILYASDAALRYILSKLELHQMGGSAMRIWLEENLVPSLSDMLAENDIDDMCTIYIDALVGQQELSYRLEKGASLGEYMYLEPYLEYLRDVRAMYLKEKERVNKIYLLRKNLFELMNLLDAEARANVDSVVEVAQELVKTLYDIIRKANEVLSMPDECKEGHSNTLKGTLVFERIERRCESSKSGVQGLRLKLSNMVGQHEEAIDAVVKALLNSIDNAQDHLPHRPAMSFLFLGLTRAGEADLAGCLAKHLVADDGTNLVIHIDLSEYTESDSLSRFLNGPLELPYGHEQRGLSLLEAVGMKPHSILLFSRVEKAHMSIFSVILSILDGYVCSINGGHTVDFRKTIVIFASDLGNKAILSRLVGHPDQGSALDDDATEQEKRGFRFELLNRIEEIVFFNPYAREQLSKVARLSMRGGPHLEDRCPLTFPMAFMHLFKMANDPFYKVMPSSIDQVASVFSKGLLVNEHCSRTERLLAN